MCWALGSLREACYVPCVMRVMVLATHLDGADEHHPVLGFWSRCNMLQSQEEPWGSRSTQRLLSLQSKSCSVIYSGWAQILNWTGVWENSGCEHSVFNHRTLLSTSFQHFLSGSPYSGRSVAGRWWGQRRKGGTWSVKSNTNPQKWCCLHFSQVPKG